MNIACPIKELIPHRGTLLLLDRITEFHDTWAVGEATPSRGAWYSDESGNMPAWIGVELMAQTIAAHVALLKRAKKQPPRLGILLGTRAYRSETTHFRADSTLTIRVEKIFMDDSGLGAYDCSIIADQRVGAAATLKVFEPDQLPDSSPVNNG